MTLIRRKWTPQAADTWTKEDWIAIFVSPLVYIGLAVGVVLSMLLLNIGFIVLIITLLLIVFMHWVIDPKLKKISEDYENKQKRYLQELEKIERWENFK